MAELASSTVSSLLGVIRSELDLLGRVRSDVLFMKEEMESMKSFLAHLSKTAPPGGAHNDQVRTWMNQVRRLALDCNHCIDLYVTRSNPEMLLARGRLRRYIRWLPWLLSKTVAQHRAAVQLRELKERARDVSERRSRYAVEAPPVKEAAAAPAGEDAEAEADQAEAEDYFTPGSLFEVPTLDDYFTGRLAEWIDNDVVKGGNSNTEPIPSIGIVAPASGPAENAVESLAGEALQVAEAHFDGMVICVGIPDQDDQPLEPDDILWCTLQELSRSGSDRGDNQQQADGAVDWHADRTGKMWLIVRMQANVRAAHLGGKLDEIEEEIKQMGGYQLDVHLRLLGYNNEDDLDRVPLSSLICMLLKSATAAAAASAEQDQISKAAMHALATWYKAIIEKTAKRLKQLVEDMPIWIPAEEEALPLILLDAAQYERILCEVFPRTTLQAPNQDTTSTSTATASIEDQIKEMIHRVTGILLQRLQAGLQEGKPDKKLEAIATTSPPGQDEFHDALIKNEAIGKVQELKKKIEKQMLIKGILDRIKAHMKNPNGTLIIFKLNHDRVYGGWEEIRDALSLLGCIAGVVIVTTGSKEDTPRHKQYCYPLREPIGYSLVGLYHDTVLKLTRQQRNADNSSYDPQVYRKVLDECEPYEFCMKIFTHSLYSNPKRSNQVLHKLHNALQVSPKSLGSIAEKMLTFSYDNLPEEYKFCLMYLAIFPRGYRIRRSVLVGRWIAEGFITKEDWQTSVCQAERCFDMLVKRCLVYPAEIGATGAVKSCMVGAIVHEFITKIAKKQCILETQISHRLARHFSIFSDLQFRASDSIRRFLAKPNKSPDFYLLKVLDLEGCRFGWVKEHYLKDICRKMLLLKYLSLRSTDVVYLPSEINNLHELEVLDIRQTKIAASATRKIRLLKLQRLLAGHIDPWPISTSDLGSSVVIPERIDKMFDMEILSNVKPQSSQDLRDIGKLWQLRKLGVVIKDKGGHLSSLFQTISDLSECLHSLSITLIPSRGLPDATFDFDHKYPPRVLESLSIAGTTQKVMLLPWLAREHSRLTKITLSNTLLSEDDLMVLSKLRMLCCLRLRQTEYTESNLTFKKGEFQKLKYFLVEGCKVDDISFDKGATPELEKIILSFKDGPKLCGVDNLSNLEELELNNTSERSNFTSTSSSNDDTTTNTTTAGTTTIATTNNINKKLLLSLLEDAKQITKVTLRRAMLKQEDLQILAKMPNLHCLVLLEESYEESQLTFNKNELPKLNVLVVNCPNITQINFTAGSCPKLEKFAWTFTKMDSLSNIANLPRLKELEFKGEFISKEVKEDISKHKNKIHFTHYKPENYD